MAFGNAYGIDLAAIGQAQEAREGNALRKLMLDKQMKALDREESENNALGSIYRPKLVELGFAPDQVEKIGGKAAQSYVTQRNTMDKDKRERLQKEAPVVARLFGDVKDAESYANAVVAARNSGIEGAEKLPTMYDPNIVGQMVRQAKAVAGPPKYDVKEGADGLYGINTETLEPTKINGVTPYRAPDNTLVEIYDPNSPTGGRMVPRAQAAGQPAAMGSGMSIESDGQGGFKLVQGKGAGKGFDKPTINDIDKQLVANTARQSRLYDIAGGFKPEYLTHGNRIQNWGTAQLEQIAPGLVSDEGKAQLAEYTTFRQRAYNDLNQTLKEMSGAAITPQEAERLLKVLGDPSNDSPTQFKAKLDEVIRDTRLAQARLMYLRTKGPEGAAEMAKIPLSSMPGIIRKRETELLREAKSANPKAGEDELKGLVRPKLQQEFAL